MIDIEFRGWYEPTKSMLDWGSLVKLINGLRLKTVPPVDWGHDPADVMLPGEIIQGNPFEMNGMKMMQYTNLLDSKGNKIFAGDICQAYKPNSYLDDRYEVVWDRAHGRWAYQSNFAIERRYQVGSGGNLKCVIIGNIHENCDMLSK